MTAIVSNTHTYSHTHTHTHNSVNPPAPFLGSPESARCYPIFPADYFCIFFFFLKKMFYYHVTIIQNKQQQKESTWYGRSQLDTHYNSLFEPSRHASFFLGKSVRFDSLSPIRRFRQADRRVPGGVVVRVVLSVRGRDHIVVQGKWHRHDSCRVEQRNVLRLRYVQFVD